jgi:transposase
MRAMRASQVQSFSNFSHLFFRAESALIMFHDTENECMGRPRGSAAELERRRRRAVALLAKGEDRLTVARILGVHPKTLARWVRLATGAEDHIAARAHPGRPARLTEAQWQALEKWLDQGPRAHGWHSDGWTIARVAALIARRFHIRYHPEHVRKLLKRHGRGARLRVRGKTRGRGGP